MHLFWKKKKTKWFRCNILVLRAWYITLITNYRLHTFSLISKRTLLQKFGVYNNFVVNFFLFFVISSKFETQCDVSSQNDNYTLQVKKLRLLFTFTVSCKFIFKRKIEILTRLILWAEHVTHVSNYRSQTFPLIPTGQKF